MKYVTYYFSPLIILYKSISYISLKYQMRDTQNWILNGMGGAEKMI